jgi:hypothetical protein
MKAGNTLVVLLAGYNKGDQFVYIRIEHAPTFLQLPQ